MRRLNWVMGGFLLGASSAIQLQADLVTISFSGTIEESVFQTPGYRVGDAMNGFVQFDNSTLLLTDGKPNYTYTTDSSAKLSLTFGANQYLGDGLRTEMHHGLNGTDAFIQSGYPRTGIPVEGSDPYFAWLRLVDPDNAYYGAMTPPYPNLFPAPDAFESRTIEMLFLKPFGGGGPIVARLDRISGPGFDFRATVPDSGLGSYLLVASLGVLAVIRKPLRGRAATPTA